MNLFDADDYVDWVEHWDGMPLFDQTKLRPTSSITVNFQSLEDKAEFVRMIGQPRASSSAWYPKIPKYDPEGVVPGGAPPNRYPIYIISKGRADTRYTSKALETLGIRYRIVIEPQEYDDYAAVIDPNKILVLPFSNLGQGSIPARNWVWEHSIEEGHQRHWILDDNINAWYRLANNQKYRVLNENPFTSCEDFVDRYDNVPMAGHQYAMFCDARSIWYPFRWNQRVYSSILLSNTATHRWRGRYNEDTDLSIRFMKDGDCTVLFYHYLAAKTATMTMGGGNSTELYKQDDQFDGRLEMAKHLRDQHPEIVNIVWKYGRWQHEVDYSRFRANKPRRIKLDHVGRRAPETRHWSGEQ